MATAVAAKARGTGRSGWRTQAPTPPPGCTAALNTALSVMKAESPPTGSAPPAAKTVMVRPFVGMVAAASATPTGERGNGSACCVHTSVVGSNGMTGRTCTVAGRRSPRDEVTVTVPVAALSGTTVRMLWSLQVLSATAAPTWPPPPRGNVTVPGASPKPKPSMTTACPAWRIGSMAPSMKSTRGTEGAGSLVPPQDSARAARAALVTAVLATHKADSL